MKQLHTYSGMEGAGDSTRYKHLNTHIWPHDWTLYNMYTALKMIDTICSSFCCY